MSQPRGLGQEIIPLWEVRRQAGGEAVVIHRGLTIAAQLQQMGANRVQATMAGQASICIQCCPGGIGIKHLSSPAA